jgi:predicted O-methyltransferase YrrM
VKVFQESVWTNPRPDCPHPEWWHSTDGQSTELEVTELVAGFVRALQPEYVIETGTCVGQTAEAVGKALQANGHGQLVTLENEPDRAAYSRIRCEGLPVVVVLGLSLEFTPTQPVDFAWLDSRTELRVPEFQHLRPWLHEGSVVGFHDTSPHQGIYGAHVEAISGTRAIRLRTPRGVTFVQLEGQ